MSNKVLSHGCDLCQSVPKVELHAHLTGSYSSETVKKLTALTKKSSDDLSWITKDIFGFDEVFKYFALAQAATCTPESVYIGATDVIGEFKADGVRYLELRTTPKNDGTMSPSEYIAALIKAVEEAEYKNTNSETGQSMVVKVILSIDRRRSLEAAATSVRLAEEFRRHVVGVDLSGDPAVGDARTFLPVLKEAQLSGWRLALHLAEIEKSEAETEAVLSALRPDRIGHGTFLKNALAENVAASGIPLELCITSNVACFSVPSFDDHHIHYWYDRKHPITICTDDKGAFRTSLSREIHIAHQLLGFDFKGVAALQKTALDCAFISQGNATTAEWNCVREMYTSLEKYTAKFS